MSDPSLDVQLVAWACELTHGEWDEIWAAAQGAYERGELSYRTRKNLYRVMDIRHEMMAAEETAQCDGLPTCPSPVHKKICFVVFLRRMAALGHPVG